MRWCVVIGVAALAASACSDTGTGPGSVLTIGAPSTDLVEGERMALSVRVGGQPVAAGLVTWTSRDPSTVTVSDGVAHAVAPGVAYVVASSGHARDSVRLTVHFRQIDANSIAIRIAGEPSAGQMQLGGRTLQYKVLGTTFEAASIHASNVPLGPDPDPWSGDTTIIIALNSGLTLGERAVKPPTIVTTPRVGVNLNSGGVFMRVLQPDLVQHLYVAVTDSRLQVSSVALPPEPGRELGAVRGSVSFEAAPLKLEVLEGGGQRVTPLSDTTVFVFAEFVTPVEYFLISPVMRVTVGGSRYAGEVLTGGYGAVVDGGVTILFNGLLGRDSDAETLFETRLWLPNPAVGAHSVTAASAEVLDDSTGGAEPWAHVLTAPFLRSDPCCPSGQLGPHEHALSRSGTVTVTEYRAPTENAFGWVIGTLTLALDYWDVTPVGQTLTVETSFRFPLEPLGGLPSARVARARGRAFEFR